MSAGKGMLWSLATIVVVVSANTDFKAVDDMVVHVRVLDTGDVEKIKVDHAAKVAEDGRFSVFSGGEFAGSEDVPALVFGTRITGKLAAVDGERNSITLKVEFSSRFDNGDKKTPVVRGEMVALTTDVKLGQVTRVSCGNNRWCELRLERQRQE